MKNKANGIPEYSTWVPPTISDSPSTTSATTYKIQIRSNVNSSRTFGTQPDQYQTITAFEISG